MNEKTTLAQLLPTIEDDAELSVGTTQGWQYIGTKAEFTELIPALDAKLQAMLDDKVVKLAKEVSTRANALCLAAQTKRPAVHGEDTVSLLLDYYRKYSDALDNQSHWKPLLKRIVTDDYIKPISGGRGIVLEGTEPGAAWDGEEWEERHCSANLRLWAEEAKNKRVTLTPTELETVLNAVTAIDTDLAAKLRQQTEN